MPVLVSTTHLGLPSPSINWPHIPSFTSNPSGTHTHIHIHPAGLHALICSSVCPTICPSIWTPSTPIHPSICLTQVHSHIHQLHPDSNQILLVSSIHPSFCLLIFNFNPILFSH